LQFDVDNQNKHPRDHMNQ